MSAPLKIHSIGMLPPPGEPEADDCPAVFLTGDADAIRSVVQFMGDSDGVSIFPADEINRLTALNEELVEALRGLRNEAGAILSMGDTLRAVTGNTNVECLQHRVKIADALLARAKEPSNG